MSSVATTCIHFFFETKIDDLICEISGEISICQSSLFLKGLRNLIHFSFFCIIFCALFHRVTLVWFFVLCYCSFQSIENEAWENELLEILTLLFTSGFSTCNQFAPLWSSSVKLILHIIVIVNFLSIVQTSLFNFSTIICFYTFSS